MSKFLVFVKKYWKYFLIGSLIILVYLYLKFSNNGSQLDQSKVKETIGALKDQLQAVDLEAAVAAKAIESKDDALKQNLSQALKIKDTSERIKKLAELAGGVV